MGLFARLHGTKGNRFKLKEKGFALDIRKKFFEDGEGTSTGHPEELKMPHPWLH